MKKLFNNKKPTRLSLVAFVLVFASVGSYFLLFSHAASLTGDLNGDNTVNVFDLSIFLGHWQQSGSGVVGDINGDNIVNIFDLSILLGNWGMTVTTAGPALSLNTTTNTISWPAIAGATDYQGATSNGPRSDSSRTTTYSDLGNVTSWTPSADCGKTDYYGVSDNADGQWSASEVSITWPACTGGGGSVTIGMNVNGLCYGRPAYLPTYHLWQRANYEASCNYPSTLKANGIQMSSAVIGNPPDATPLANITIGNGSGAPDAVNNWLAYALSQADDAVANGGANLPLEVGNEMYLKGGGYPNTNPQKYAQMFNALANARPTYNLLFSAEGDYQRANGTWSQTSGGGGWLGDAATAVPTIKTQVRGFVFHPYGSMKPTPENDGDSSGPGALPVVHDNAYSLGFTNAAYWYLTEYGSSYPTAADGDSQAADCQYAYNWFLGLTDAHGIHYVRNITWFDIYDYAGMNPPATGAYNADWSPRPVMNTLQSFGVAQGQ